ncbi:MAG: tRNA (adenosine(37)-N6)-dimethylallyltransferase MiaA [Coriobacteriales bacterium]|jgi:tRNA dimethylallyltransferase|nr:tRNA (adenosine(37)-N6)-dimethylallyltransferase MiaA [Coriobacteriales bacterium]
MTVDTAKPIPVTNVCHAGLDPVSTVSAAPSNPVPACHQQPIIAIVGATATGKSRLADLLAVKLDAEIISADSMQVYRGMDIGTAKTPVAERSVSYHGLDLVDPDFRYTAALYQRMARAQIAEIQQRGRRVIFCGGTGLYLRAALDDFEFDQGFDSSCQAECQAGPDHTSALEPRVQLQQQADALGPEAFHTLLSEHDPESAALIHPNNVRRVIRAFELLGQGSSYAKQSGGFSSFQSFYPVILVGLHLERDMLYQMIEQRVDAMLEAGLLGEVEALVEQGFAQSLTAMQAIGYKELLLHLEGQISLTEAAEQIKQATRRYAKRQISWFKRDPRIKWLDITDLHKQGQAGKLTSEEFGEQLTAPFFLR